MPCEERGGKPLWLGLAGFVLGAAAIATALLLGPERTGPGASGLLLSALLAFCGAGLIASALPQSERLVAWSERLGASPLGSPYAAGAIAALGSAAVGLAGGGAPALSSLSVGIVAGVASALAWSGAPRRRLVALACAALSPALLTSPLWAESTALQQAACAAVAVLGVGFVAQGRYELSALALAGCALSGPLASGLSLAAGTLVLSLAADRRGQLPTRLLSAGMALASVAVDRLALAELPGWERPSLPAAPTGALLALLFTAPGWLVPLASGLLTRETWRRPAVAPSLALLLTGTLLGAPSVLPAACLVLLVGSVAPNRPDLGDDNDLWLRRAAFAKAIALALTALLVLRADALATLLGS